MFGILAQAWLIPFAPVTSQAGSRAQTPNAHTPEQHVQVDRVPEFIPVQSVIPVQYEVREAASERE